MALLPAAQKDQIKLFIGILGLLGAGAYWNYIYSPKTGTLDLLEARVEKLDASNQRARTIISRGTTEQLEAEAAALKDNLSLMRTLIPVSNEVPALLDEILGAARRTGLDFSNFQPSGVTPGESFDTYRYKMSLQGSYHEIGTLLTAIGGLRRIIAPINVALAPAPVGGTQLRNARPRNPEQPILTANFEVQTYVVKTTPTEDKP